MNEEYQKAKRALIKFYIQIKYSIKNLVNKFINSNNRKMKKKK
jgi:hypothetical protein